MDILYSLKNIKYCEELNYSLRSLKNIPHDKVFIVGGFPDNINKDKVVSIYRCQNFNSRFTNSINNLVEAVNNEQLSEDFVYMNDDFFILNPICDIHKELNLCFIKAKDFYDKIKNKKDKVYVKNLYETIGFLNNVGIKNPKFYDLHTPFVYNKSKVKYMFKRYSSLKYSDNPYTRTVYGNLFLKDSTVIEKDCKIFETSDFDITPEQKFLSCSDKGFKKIKPYLQKLFDKKSEYEL